MKLHLTWRTAGATVLLLALLILAVGSWRDPEFWRSADRRGDHLMQAKDYKAAAAAYSDPDRKSVV